MNKSKHKHLDGQIIIMYKGGKSTFKIARELGLRSSTIGYRVKMLGISRSISESLVGQAKSEAHKKSLSETRIKSGVAKGSKNPNWQGGKETLRQKRVSDMKNDRRYKEWKKAVRSLGYCESCGSAENLHAHHILSKAKFPHLIYDISNGKCLCKSCHQILHNGVKFHSDELLETLTVNDEGNQQPSLQSRKVQRLLENSDVLNNQDAVSDTKVMI